MTIVDTPDNQRGVYNPQQSLATVAAHVATVLVSLPPNAETLVITARKAGGVADPKVVGVTTGLHYQTVRTYIGESPNEHTTTFADVSTAVDSEVTVEWPVAPELEWQVYADAYGHLTTDPNIASATSQAGFASPAGVLQVGGRQGEHVYPIRVDNRGVPYATPIIPSTLAGEHPPDSIFTERASGGVGTIVVPAPGLFKRNRLYFYTMASTAAGGVWALTDTATGGWYGFCVGAQSASGLYPAQGIAQPENSSLQLQASGSAGELFATVFYSIENI